MRNLSVLSLFAVLSFYNAQATDRTEKKVADKPGEKKSGIVCKKGEISGVEIEACLPEKNASGKELICTIVVFNKTEKPINYNFHDKHWDFIFDVTGSDGREASKTRFGEVVFKNPPTNCTQRFIAPGRFMKFKCNLSQYFDLTVPGEYFVTITAWGIRVDGKVPVVDALRVVVEDE